MQKKWESLRAHITPLTIVYGLLFLVPLAVYLNRFLIPDFGFDTLYYHLFNGARGAYNGFWPFSHQEFYPNDFGSLPALYDSLFYLVRKIVGYRLGTIPGVVAYWVIMFVAYKLFMLYQRPRDALHPFVKLTLLFNTIIVTELLFQLATYMVDILDVSLILLGVYAFLLYIKNSQLKLLIFASLLFGIAFLAKATNIIYLLPFYVLAVHAILRCKTYSAKRKICLALLIGVLAIAPTACYDLFNLIKTGNPFFPLYNGIFQSSYYAPISFNVANYGAGPIGIIQKLFWPIISFWHASRLAEPHSLFNDWKLGSYWVIALIMCIPKIWQKWSRSEKYLLVFFLISVQTWSMSVGILRYAAADTILGGIILAVAVSKLMSAATSKIRLLLGAVTVIVILISSVRILAFNFRYDISWRPNLVHNASAYLQQRHNLFRGTLDNPNPLPPATMNSLVGLDCAPQSTGLLALSQYHSAPVLNVMLKKIHDPNSFMTDQKVYRIHVASILYQQFHTNQLHFVAYTVSEGLDVGTPLCQQNLKLIGAHVDAIIPLASYLGYADEHVIMTRGTLNLQQYVNAAVN